jgi:hypothetical protein
MKALSNEVEVTSPGSILKSTPLSSKLASSPESKHICSSPWFPSSQAPKRYLNCLFTFPCGYKHFCSPSAVVVCLCAMSLVETDVDPSPITDEYTHIAATAVQTGIQLDISHPC